MSFDVGARSILRLAPGNSEPEIAGAADGCQSPLAGMLATFLVRGVGMLPRRLGVLLRRVRVLMAFGVVAFAMVFGGGAVRLGGILVMFGCLGMLFLGHKGVSGC